MKLVLHIGRHKSGTSSLQHWLYCKREDLKKDSFLYPMSGLYGRVAHHELARALHPKTLDLKKVGHIAAGIKKEASTDDIVILSSEAFQNLASVDAVQDFTSALGVPKSSILVVCYLREHIDYAMSAYRQAIQNQPAIMSFVDYVARFSDQASFFSRWRDVGALAISWFSRDTLASGNVIEDFCKKVGISSCDYFMDNKNVSIGGNLLVCKLASNLLGIEGLSYSGLSKLAERYARFSNPFFIDRRWCNKIRDISSYNQSIVAELGPPPSLQDWENYDELPSLESLKVDVELICNELSLPDAARLQQASMATHSFFATR